MSGSGMSRSRHFEEMVEVFDEEEREQARLEQVAAAEVRRRESIRNAWNRIDILALLRERKAEEKTRAAVKAFEETQKKWNGKGLIKLYDDAANKKLSQVDLKHTAVVTSSSSSSMKAAMASTAVVIPGNAIPTTAVSAQTGTLSVPPGLKLPEPSSCPATPAVSAASSPARNISNLSLGPDSPNANAPHLFASVPLPAPRQAISVVSSHATTARVVSDDKPLFGDEFVKGYTRGYTEGKQDGFKDGYKEGGDHGYTDGYGVGISQGYQRGYAEKNVEIYEGAHAAGYGKAVDDFNTASLWHQKSTADASAEEPAPRTSRCWSFCRSS